MTMVRVAAATAVPEGGMIAAEASGEKLLLAKVDGHIYATQRKCPHLGFSLCRGHLDGRSVVCLLHGAKFDLETGAIERDPKLFFIGMKAKSGLRTFPVTIAGDEVMIEL